VSGIPALKKAIVNKFKNENGFDYAINEVIVGVGGKQTIFNLCLAVLNKGDEVIIPAPYWVSYADIALVAEAKPVIIECGIEQGFKLLPAQLEAAITPKTKIVMFNSPSNPTGAVYSLDELKALGEVLLKHPHVLVATDDMYEHVNLTGDQFYNILNATPALKDRCIVLNGVSKAYSMTGWRIGYAAGPAYIIKAMEILQSQSTSNPTSISQYAAEAALSGSQDCIKPMVEAFIARHKYVVDRFNTISGLSCLMAGGAFYAFPDARVAINNLHNAGKIKEATDMALAEYLLESFNVAVVPGSAFGAEGYFRISFATSMENLKEALNRIEQALS
jgi:aspartate aminotransferase